MITLDTRKNGKSELPTNNIINGKIYLNVSTTLKMLHLFIISKYVSIKSLNIYNDHFVIEWYETLHPIKYLESPEMRNNFREKLFQHYTICNIYYTVYVKYEDFLNMSALVEMWLKTNCNSEEWSLINSKKHEVYTNYFNKRQDFTKWLEEAINK